MGNLYSVAEAGIDYLFRGIFYLFSPVLPRGHIDLTRENVLTQADDGNSQTIDESLHTDEDNGCKSYSVYILNSEESSGNNSRTASCFIDILKDFFRNYNFQTSVLSGNARERRRIVETERRAYNTFLNNEKISNKWNVGVTVDVERFGQQGNVAMEIPTTCWQITEVKKVSNSRRKRSDERLKTAVEDKGCSSSSDIGVQNADGNFEKSFPSNIENPFHKSRERKRGFVPTDEVLSQLEHLREEFSGDVPRSTNRNVSKNDCKAREVSRVTEFKVKKLSLPDTHPGCRFYESEENIQSSDFSLDSPTFDAAGENYRRVSNPNLYSGGLVAFGELSERLSIPNYYADDSVFYSKHPDAPKVPPSSPVNLTASERSLVQRSCSGGGVVVDNSKRISLPDLFPQKNLLLLEMAANKRKQSSASSERLVKPKVDDEGIICSDLSRSRRFATAVSDDKNVNNYTGREPSKSVSF